MPIKPKISIIVPVYKAEKYLHRCVDSILAQTFTDFELLLIDDGSPDSSGEICDQYASADSRVRVFHKPNGGVSSARQCGLDNAQGEYTIHADPDDWVEPDMLQELYAEAKLSNADMVICDFFKELGNGETKFIKQRPTALDSDSVIRQLLFQQLHGSCWNKLVKRVCYTKWNVKFPNGVTYCEDLFVICSILMQNINVSYKNKAYYHYIISENINSLSAPVNGSFESDYLMFSNFIELFDGTKFKDDFTNKFAGLICLRNFWRNKDNAIQYARHCFPLIKYIKPFNDFKGYCMILFSSIGLYPFIKYLHSIKHR